jgi:2-polyprenyl-3-methyl-5-hydroxy-6-metoxy-1,4-benzoquinol methylase
MDERTLGVYDAEAAGFAAEWDAQPVDTELQAIVRRYFAPGPTADIGCGSGRDAAWLAGEGFDVTGFDGSEWLLAEARRAHPQVVFHRALLPELAGIGDAGFANVLCETVIMHLAPAVLAASVRRLVGLLRPGGTLYLSWRVTEGADLRDGKGRLYAAFEPEVVLAALAGCAVLLDEQATSLSSGRTVRRVVARRAG